MSDGPRSVQISPAKEKEYYEEGDQFTCSAEGNPSPTYTWEFISGSGNAAITNENTLEVTKDMAGWYNYSCEASNVMSGSGTSKYATTTYLFHVGGTYYQQHNKYISLQFWFCGL